MECFIEIRLKPGLHDPQGQAILSVAERFGCQHLKSVHVGRLVILEFSSSDQALAEKEVEKILKQLLVNPLIEDCTIQWRS